MKTITYNLSGQGSDYYNDVRRLADKTDLYFMENLVNYYSVFSFYLVKEKVENIRTRSEYIYDFLSAGTYLNLYTSYSRKSSRPLLRFQRNLYFLRRKQRALKPYIDPLRGIISSGFLYRTKKKNRESNNTLKDFYKLILWLDATGEFREETKRFKLIHGFLSTQIPEIRTKMLEALIQFAKWFEEESFEILGRYTKNVNSFLRERHEEYKWKENYIFTGRKRIEYHLSMVGAELMNRGFTNSFKNTKKRALLVPACMRIKQDGSCKAIEKNFDMKCTGCSSECRVFKLTQMAKAKNCSVHIIPHSSDFTKWLKTWAVGTDVGVVGVACPLNLITGGLELKSLDIPSQCLLLDYCGCKNHWDKEGIPTDLNEKELKRIIALA